MCIIFVKNVIDVIIYVTDVTVAFTVVTIL
jgi:hypothetical protein